MAHEVILPGEGCITDRAGHFKPDVYAEMSVETASNREALPADVTDDPGRGRLDLGPAQSSYTWKELGFVHGVCRAAAVGWEAVSAGGRSLAQDRITCPGSDHVSPGSRVKRRKGSDIGARRGANIRIGCFESLLREAQHVTVRELGIKC